MNILFFCAILSFRRRRNHTRNSAIKIVNLCRATSVISPLGRNDKNVSNYFYLEFLNSFKISSITQLVLAAEVPFEGEAPSLLKSSPTTVSIKGC